jgi:hypothetical protein
VLRQLGVIEDVAPCAARGLDARFETPAGALPNADVDLVQLPPSERKRSEGAGELGRSRETASETRWRGMERPKNEREFYRRIISRAKTVRERAAESLRQPRALRKGQGEARSQPDAAPKRRRFRRPN